MANEAPTAASAEVDHVALLLSEKAELEAQLQELGFGTRGDTGLNYDSNFADSSQVTAERGEAERLATELRDALQEVDAALERLSAGNYGLCQAGGALLHCRRRQALSDLARRAIFRPAPDGPVHPADPVDRRWRRGLHRP